jgi:hypothetical protein
MWKDERIKYENLNFILGSTLSEIEKLKSISIKNFVRM